MKDSITKIAVIGMSCRFPGADNIDEYWNNLVLGKESLTQFTDEEIKRVEPYFDRVKNNRDYIKVRGILNDVDQFDASFFGMTPREADETDPQQRIWLETAWNALVHAGCNPSTYKGAIGVFAGGAMSSYFINNILRDDKRRENFLRPDSGSAFQMILENDIANLPTKTAYQFNLRGPAVYSQTACSTSLVTIAMACQSLYSYESDVCLAGGVKISLPQERGYLYQEGGITSPDGHCRPFDAQSKGTVNSNGVGVVVLKRMEDALKDNDTIYAVVSGWALNNDGSNKVSFTAPGIDGQAEVIMMAQSMAEVLPEEIGYVEAHGTATQLGDPIEIAGLTKAFSAKTDKKQFCGLGSVKSNIGHTDSAAGVASFIKVCLSAYYKKIPQTLHFTKPNPHIDFANSPFYVLNQLKTWTEDKPLIMGVSSFGIGGTNAHVIVEQPPVPSEVKSSASEWPELILLSARSKGSLERSKHLLSEFCRKNQGLKIHDVAGTLASGRNHMPYRSFLVASTIDDIISGEKNFTDGSKSDQSPSLVYMFPGQGSQYVKMGLDLYKNNSVFRDILDQCFSLLKTETGQDLKAILFNETDIEVSERRLADTELTQPALFIVEYALARLLEQLGIRPDNMVGHSIGEYVSACLSGVFDMNSALKIVIKRSQLMSKMPNGRMMAVRAGFEQLKSISASCFEIAADNAPESCTVSFKTEEEERVKSILDANGITYLELNTSHAFHSEAFEPILKEFTDYVNQFNLQTPEIPFISCLTGTFITDKQATSGTYWAQQLRNTVRFREGISKVTGNEGAILLEVGPNTHLSSLVRQSGVSDNKLIIATLGKYSNVDERYRVMATLGKMYNAGFSIDFEILNGDRQFRKIGLPAYPFENKRHWVEPDLTHLSDTHDEQIAREDQKLSVVSKNKVDNAMPGDLKDSGSASERIMYIWRSMIGSDNIGPDDDFFEIGGHSLLALQIITRIKEDLGLSLSLKEFLDNPTINKLATRFGVESGAVTKELGLTNEVSISDFPLSYMQKKLWIISKLDSVNPAYNIPFTYRLSGEINIEVFNESLNNLFNRHFILFSHFRERDGNPFCEIIPEPVKVELSDFSAGGPDESEEKVLSFIGKNTRKQFDLENGPLYRLYLLKLNDSTWYFYGVIHHILFDGWSFGVFVRDLKKIYKSLLLKEELKLEDVRESYFEYARAIQTEEHENPSVKKFWIENLRGCSPLMNFPYDSPRKEISSGFGERYHITVPREYTEKIKEIAKKERATPFATLLSIMGILFNRYCGEDDLCIGIHVANRSSSKLEKIFGMFVNTIPVRLQIGENQTFSSFIGHTKNVLLESISHQELPFEKIVEVINPERFPNVNPIFQVAMQWINYSAKHLEFEGFNADRVEVNEGISPLDITFNLWENDGQIEGELEYNSDILRRETVKRLVDNFICLVKSAVEDPDRPLSLISVLSEYDRQKLAEFNNTEVDVPDALVHNLFEAQALQTPGNKAVISGGSALTYRDLDAKSNQLARHLVSLGVKGGDVVGICHERSVDMVVSVLGVLKAGCCYLPMDPIFPDERIAYMYEDSGAKVLISQSSLKEKFKHFPDTTVVLTDSDSKQISGKSTDKVEISITNQSLVYMIYTSGSTGKPKGVKVHHEAVVNFLQSMKKKPGISSDDRLLAVTTLSFDISVLELFLPLTSGAGLIIADTEDIFDGDKLSGLLQKHDVTIMQATPATWNILLGHGWKGKKNLKALCGGEAILPGLVRELLPRVQSLWNMYGPTETTVWSACKELKDAEPPILVGTPIDNTQIYILDKQNNTVPIGVTGEVCIGGLGVTKGYNKRPELTSEKFIEYGEAGVIYRTGDLGRFLSDGNIELFGRSDNQIKLRGFRIEPGEIESLLSKLPSVKEAVVKVQRFEDNDERLVAFLNTDSDFALAGEEISKTLLRQLPSYMIPAFYKITNSFPRLPNGKIDKKKLVFENKEPDQVQQIDFELSTPTQKTLKVIWEKILKTRNISPLDDFFDVGGNSLLGIRIINKIREEFGFALAFRDLIKYSSISQLGSFIDSQTSEAAESFKLVHLTRSTNLPLTNNQKRIWLLSQSQPESPLYVIAFTYKFYGMLDRDIFEKSINLLLDRHYILFSTIKEENGEPYCDIKTVDNNIKFIDYSGQNGDDAWGKVKSFITSLSREPFDLINGPLFRFFLIKTAENEYCFHMGVHHIVFDGWSQGILINDLTRIYNGLLRKEQVVLDKLECQQFDFAEWEKESEDDQESYTFWEENLKGCSTILNFPYDYQNSERSLGQGGLEEIRLSRVLSDDLRKLSKDEGTSLFSTLMTAYGILMNKYSGQDDLNIGLPVAYRPHSKLENIVGMFVNTVVVRLKFESGATFKDALDMTNTSALSAITHQELPFESVVKIVNPARNSYENPLFQVAFTWQNNLSAPFKFEGITSKAIVTTDRFPIFNITMYLWENRDVIEGLIEYNKDILKPSTILRLKRHFIKLLNSMTSGVNTRISSSELISDEELNLIETVNNTAKSFTSDKTVIQLFEKSVSRDPGHIALISDAGQYTYSELNDRANKLAGILQQNNIGNGDFVGILLRRSPELIITLLALFKTGAAYVPLNLTDPEGRIHSILDTAGIKFLITNSDTKLTLRDNNVRLNIEQLITQSENVVFDSQKIKLDSSDSAYIIFTSGTTGTPKGVWVNHRSVVNLIEWVNETFQVSGKDKLLWVTNLSFDLSVYDIFGILLAGGTVRILNDDDRMDPQKQYEILLKERITFWDSAPQTLLQLTPYFTSGADNLKSLRLVFLSGDWIPLTLPGTITSAFPSAVVVGLGGATEATVWSNYFIVGQLNPEWKSIPYGKPIQNSRYYILDESMNQCLVQQPGNLYIGGECLALGYYNDPDLTNSKFVDDPFNPGSRIYLTGDKAQWMSDGNIEFLGRDDNQMKIRGYRVELGEINNAVLQNKSIKEAFVIPDKSDKYDIKVVLFITTVDDVKLDTNDLRRELHSNLAEYMIPSDIIHCNNFPLTANGKIDTKALLSLYLKSKSQNTLGSFCEELSKESKAYSQTKMKIHKIWSEVLKTNKISLSDDFFNIGGYSLLGIRIVNRVREEFGIRFTFRDFLNNSTIIKLSALIENQTKSAGETIQLVHLEETGNLPLTKNQKGLWVISQFQPDVASYIIPITYRLNGEFDREIFERSINTLFERHHIVFSVIKEINSEPFCQLLKRDVNISYSDLSGNDDTENEARVLKIVNEASGMPFDLSQGPLFRLYLIKTGENVHYFHISIHHIIFDGWSAGIFIQELGRIYNSLKNGQDLDLDKLDYQQYDYAQWESAAKERPESVEYWKENLTGCSPLLNFPFDFPRSAKSAGRCKAEGIQLSPDLSEKLRKISKEEGTSLFTTLMSVFGIQMHKYSGDNDLNLGVPVAYRPHSALEKIFGMFVNTVTVRLKYENSPSFRELIKQTDHVAGNAISHQAVPFERVVELVKPERIPGANPLFQVAFAWQNNLGESMSLEGITSEKVNTTERSSNFDLILYLWEHDSIIEGEFEYNTDVIRPETITRLKENFLNLADNLVERIDEPVISVPMLTEKDKLLITDINNTGTSYPKDKSISQLFEEQVILFPAKTALVFKNETLTYKELNERANQLARTLTASGVLTNTPVGILAEKSVELIIGLIAILKAGGVYVPIDPEYPEQRIHMIIEDSGCKILLLNKQYNSLKAPGIRKIDLDSSRSYDTGKSNLKPSPVPAENAYIMYTSGTTGKPKGSIIPQRGVVRLVRNTNYLELKPDDRLLLTGAIVFDASTFEIWGMLLNGGTLYVIDRETLLDPAALEEELIRNDIKILWLTSALFTQIAEQKADVFRKLNYLLSGGDVLSVQHVNKVRRDNPNLKLLNCYGPTENTTFSTTFLIEKDFEYNIPVGKPISNSTTYIFDKTMNYRPVGLIGDLYVGGDGLSAGYLNREDLNKASFKENPYNPGERLYRTGDLARLLPDGNIEFHGRADNQLKIRGFRVELEEIESVISEIEGVIEAVVKPIKVEEGDYRLVAFLNVTADFSMEPKEIAKLIRKKLPSHMVPSAFKCMQGFPRTINGKIDKNALLYDLKEQENKPSDVVENFTPTVRTIHNIFCKVLNSNNVPVDESFYEIGGNSLLGLRLINLLREEFKISLTFKELVMNSTIDQLGVLIDAQIQKPGKEINLVHLPGTKHLPLTRNQKRLWVLSKFQTENPVYTVPLTIRFKGSFNREIFERSIDILFRRHKIVFSVIKEDQGNPYCNLEQFDISIPYFDYSGFSADQKMNMVNALIKEDSRKPFDLENGPLFRLYLVKKENDEFYFHMSIHHIIFDGWSIGVLTNDLGEIYNSLSGGREPGLVALDFQQYDYANWENEVEDNSESIEFWKNNLSGCSATLNFPYDFQRKEVSSGRGNVEPLRLSKKLSDSLRNFSRQTGSSLFTSLMGAFGVLMQKYSGDDDINIGLPVAHRPHTKLEKIFGMFVDTVVVRFRFDQKMSFREIIKQSHNLTMNAISHQDLPFEKVVEIVNPERIPGANPLFQIAFEWQNNLSVPAELQGLNAELIKGKEGNAIFDLSIALWENGDIIEGELNYNVDLLKKETVARCRDKYIQLLNTLTDNPDMGVSEFSLLSDDDNKKLSEFNNTDADIPACLIQEFFEKQSQIRPGATAIVSGESSLTYKELNERSNQLSNYLASIGVSGGNTVGIFLERSTEAVISVLAVLKAGCSYLPLDPSFPGDRIDFMVRDSGAKIMISRSSLLNDAKITGLSSVVLLDTEKERINSCPVTKTQISADPDQTAYIIYTSGSTGRPKGVPIRHRSVVNLIESMSRTPGISDKDRLLAVITLSFDMSVYELFLTLSNGATLVIADKNEVTNGPAIIDLINKHNITVIQATPSFWQILVLSGWKGKKDLVGLCGGEALSPALIREVLPKVREFWNCYGPTETTVYATFCRITDANGRVHIGKPLNNTRIYVLDKINQILPPGITGEVAIGGAGVSEGYLNRKELTDEKFIKMLNGEIIYKSGDLGRHLEDGNVELFGRADNQIKLRGFRIEPGEIENFLSVLPDVTEAIVKIQRFGEGDDRIVAFVNAKSSFNMTSDQINSYLAQRVPPYMIPSFYQITDGFPRLPNGKINRKALLIEMTETEDGFSENNVDVTPTEAKLVEIWSDVLKQKRFRISDNFFNIGGNSILAIMVMSQIRSAFDVDLGLRKFFESPRIKDIAEALDILKHKPGNGKATDDIKSDSRIVTGEL
jgi:amino acid adenylation domain-containing protein